MAVFTNTMRFTGFSGIDTTDMVRQIMNAESMRLHNLQRQRQRLQWQQQDLRGVANSMRAFQDRFLTIASADAIHASANIQARKVTVDGVGVTASATSNATPGTWTVETHAVATSGRMTTTAATRNITGNDAFDASNIGADDSIRLSLGGGASREINIGQIAAGTASNNTNTSGWNVTGNAAFDFNNIEYGDTFTITLQDGRSVELDLYAIANGRTMTLPNGTTIPLPVETPPGSGTFLPEGPAADNAEFVARLNQELARGSALGQTNTPAGVRQSVVADITADGQLTFIGAWSDVDMNISASSRDAFRNTGFGVNILPPANTTGVYARSDQPFDWASFSANIAPGDVITLDFEDGRSIDLDLYDIYNFIGGSSASADDFINQINVRIFFHADGLGPIPGSPIPTPVPVALASIDPDTGELVFTGREGRELTLTGTGNSMDLLGFTEPYITEDIPYWEPSEIEDPDERFLYDLNAALAAEFGQINGENRVLASIDSQGRIVFETTNAQELSITAGQGDGLANLGGFTDGANTSTYTGARLIDVFGMDLFGGDNSININGTSITLTPSMTIAEAMQAINNSDAGVTMTFNGLNNTFSIAGNGTGIDSRVSLGDDDRSSRFFAGFGFTPGASVIGDNARVTVTGPDGVAINVERGTNQFNLSSEIGLNFTVTNSSIGETTTIDIAVDQSRTREVITSFVEEYNALVRELSELRNTPRPRGSNNQVFEPLLDHERAEMSESEIRQWEERSREGMLHRSQEIEFALDRMRRAMHEGVQLEDGTTMHLFEFGITMELSGNVSTLRINESQLDTALSNIPEERTLAFFTGLQSNVNEALNTGATRIQQVAGTDNQQYGTVWQRRIEDIDSRLASMEDRLRMREQGLFAMFGRLEAAIMQSNAQMEMLWQMTGF